MAAVVKLIEEGNDYVFQGSLDGKGDFKNLYYYDRLAFFRDDPDINRNITTFDGLKDIPLNVLDELQRRVINFFKDNRSDPMYNYTHFRVSNVLSNDIKDLNFNVNVKLPAIPAGANVDELAQTLGINLGNADTDDKKRQKVDSAIESYFAFFSRDGIENNNQALQLALVTTHGLEGLYVRQEENAQGLNQYWRRVTVSGVGRVVSDFHKRAKCGGAHKG